MSQIETEQEVVVTLFILEGTPEGRDRLGFPYPIEEGRAGPWLGFWLGPWVRHELTGGRSSEISGPGGLGEFSSCEQGGDGAKGKN